MGAGTCSPSRLGSVEVDSGVAQQLRHISENCRKSSFLLHKRFAYFSRSGCSRACRHGTTTDLVASFMRTATSLMPTPARFSVRHGRGSPCHCFTITVAATRNGPSLALSAPPHQLAASPSAPPDTMKMVTCPIRVSSLTALLHISPSMCRKRRIPRWNTLCRCALIDWKLASSPR